MDGRMVGLAGGIAGSVIGVIGGLIGTYFSIRNTNGPRERAFMVRVAILGSLVVIAFLAALIFTPLVWRTLLWVVYGPALMLFIRWGNRKQQRARVIDEAERARSPSDGTGCE